MRGTRWDPVPWWPDYWGRAFGHALEQVGWDAVRLECWRHAVVSLERLAYRWVRTPMLRPGGEVANAIAARLELAG